MMQSKDTDLLTYTAPEVQCYVIQSRTEILTLSSPGYPENLNEEDPFDGEDDIF